MNNNVKANATNKHLYVIAMFLSSKIQISEVFLWIYKKDKGIFLVNWH